MLDTDAHTRAQELAARATIAVITALPKEMAAMKKMLDEPIPYSTPGRAPGEYVLGEVPAKNGGTHAVVLACSWMGENLAAANVAIVLERLPTVKAVVMVGIAGAAPDAAKLEHDVRLGDIVVPDTNGVFQYDLDKETLKNGEVERVHRHPPRPPGARWLTADRDLQMAELEGTRPWEAHFKRANKLKWTRRPTQPDDDILHKTDNPNEVITRIVDPQRRKGKPSVFRGPIASGNKLLKNAVLRDRLLKTFGVKAVEMEAAGVADSAWLNTIEYFVVRGTCDYCDTHKADQWQGYAAMISAAYARALLEQMRVEAPSQGQTAENSPTGGGVPTGGVMVNNYGTVGQQVVVKGDAYFSLGAGLPNDQRNPS